MSDLLTPRELLTELIDELEQEERDGIENDVATRLDMFSAEDAQEIIRGMRRIVDGDLMTRQEFIDSLDYIAAWAKFHEESNRRDVAAGLRYPDVNAIIAAALGEDTT